MSSKPGSAASSPAISGRPSARRPGWPTRPGSPVRRHTRTWLVVAAVMAQAPAASCRSNSSGLMVVFRAGRDEPCWRTATRDQLGVVLERGWPSARGAGSSRSPASTSQPWSATFAGVTPATAGKPCAASRSAHAAIDPAQRGATTQLYGRPSPGHAAGKACCRGRARPTKRRWRCVRAERSEVSQRAGRRAERVPAGRASRVASAASRAREEAGTVSAARSPAGRVACEADGGGRASEPGGGRSGFRLDERVDGERSEPSEEEAGTRSAARSPAGRVSVRGRAERG